MMYRKYRNAHLRKYGFLIDVDKTMPALTIWTGKTMRVWIRRKKKK